MRRASSFLPRNANFAMIFFGKDKMEVEEDRKEVNGRGNFCGKTKLYIHSRNYTLAILIKIKRRI